MNHVENLWDIRITLITSWTVQYYLQKMITVIK